MRVTVVPNVIGALERVPKSLEKNLVEQEKGGIIKTIQTTSLLRLATILRGVLDLRRLAVPQTPVAQLAGSVELFNCVSREDLNPHSVLDMTLNNLMARLQSRRLGECGVTFH